MSSHLHPTVSAIILNYNGAALLDSVLVSLESLHYSALQIIVSDNGSTDDSAVVAERHGCVWDSLGFNAGFSLGNNHGAMRATGEFLWFLNNDVYVTPDSLFHLVCTMRRDDDLFAADPMMLDQSGAVIEHGGPALVSIPLWQRTNFLPCIAIDYVARPHDTIDIPWGCGGSILVRRSMFSDLGGFDPSFVFGYEDADLCWRAWRRGWRTRYVPEAKVYHAGGASFRAFPEQAVRRVYSSARNRQRFIWKSMGLRSATLNSLLTLLYGLLRLMAAPRHHGARAAILSVLGLVAEADALARERRHIRATARVDSSYLLGQFLAIGRGSQCTVALPHAVT